MATDERIFDSTWECKDLFERCRTSVMIWDDDDLDRLDECEADFALWAHGLRADKTGHSSFDYRLRDRPDIQGAVLNLLREIAKSLDLLIRSDSLQNTSDMDGDQGEDDSDAREPISFSWADYPGIEDSPSQAEEPHIPSSPVSRHLYYIQMDLDILKALSVAIKRAGVKFRYERADRALPSAPTSYDSLRSHLAHLILVKPYIILLRMLDLAVLHKCVPPLVALLIRKWVHDDSRSYEQLNDLIQGVVVRHNRIQFARKPWRPGQPRGGEEPRGNTPPNTRRLKSALVGPSTTLVLAIANTSPHPNDSQPAIQGTTHTWSPHVDTSDQLRRGASSIPPTTSITASGIASSFILPSVDIIKRNPVGAVTEITWTGLQEDYPPRPSTAKGARTFVCPYCYHNLPVEYMKTKARWRGHVAHDILPYTCVFPDCAKSTTFYNTREDWILHMKHNHSFQGWVCEECPVQLGDTTLLTFDSVDSWANHTRQVHNRALTNEQASALAMMSERKLLDWIQCPLCPRSKRLYSLEEDEHIARHLHSFALESLPEDIAQDLHSSNYHDHSCSSSDPPDHVDYKQSLGQYLKNLKPSAYSPEDVTPKRVSNEPLEFRKVALLLDLDEIPVGYSAFIYDYIEPLLYDGLSPFLFHSNSIGKGLLRVTVTEAYEMLHREGSTGFDTKSAPPNIPDILNTAIKDLQESEWSEIAPGEQKILLLPTFGKWITTKAINNLISNSTSPHIKIHIVLFSEDGTEGETAGSFAPQIGYPAPAEQVLGQVLGGDGKRDHSDIITSERYELGSITGTLLPILVDNVSKETNSAKAAPQVPIQPKPSHKEPKPRTPGPREVEISYRERERERQDRMLVHNIPSYRLREDRLKELLERLFIDAVFQVTLEDDYYRVRLPRNLTQAESSAINELRNSRRDYR